MLNSSQEIPIILENWVAHSANAITVNNKHASMKHITAELEQHNDDECKVGT